LESVNEVIGRAAEKFFELTPAVYPVSIPFLSVANTLVSVPDAAESIGIDVDGRKPQRAIDDPFAKLSFFLE
jgi:hypothetical protein